MLKQLLHKTLVDAASQACSEVSDSVKNFDSMLRRANFGQGHHYSSTLLLHYSQLAKLGPTLFSSEVATVRHASHGYLDLKLSAETIARALCWLKGEVSARPGVSGVSLVPAQNRDLMLNIIRRIGVIENAAQEERFDIVESCSLGTLPHNELLSNDDVVVFPIRQYFLQDTATVINYSHVITAACDALDVRHNPVRFSRRAYELASHLEDLLARTAVVASDDGCTGIQLNILSSSRNVLELALN